MHCIRQKNYESRQKEVNIKFVCRLHMDSVNTSKTSSLLCPFFHILGMIVHCEEMLLILLSDSLSILLIKILNISVLLLISREPILHIVAFTFTLVRDTSSLLNLDPFLPIQHQALSLLLPPRLQLLLVVPQLFLKVWQ